MTPSQTSLYWRLWGQACRAQGWTTKQGMTSAQIDAQRKRVHRVLLGVESSSEIDKDEGFTKIKEHLLDLANVINTNTADNPRRTSLWRIRHELLPCLALYEPDLDGYLKKLFADRFKLFQGVSTIEDLSTQTRFVNGEEKPSPMEMLKFTLTARIQTKRKESGDTGHIMKMRARVACDCKLCGGRVPALPQSEPVHIDQPAEELVGAATNNPF